jgi:hypothetical protein
MPGKSRQGFIDAEYEVGFQVRVHWRYQSFAAAMSFSAIVSSSTARVICREDVV